MRPRAPLHLFSASLAAEAQATRTPRIGYLGTENATPVSAQLRQWPGGSKRRTA